MNEKKKLLLAELRERNPDALLADGFEDAFVGIASQFTRCLAAYDRAKCINILVTRDGMTEEEAEEFFGFNVEGAWVGDNTPVFMELEPQPWWSDVHDTEAAPAPDTIDEIESS